jgi:Ca2+-binding RTX toxin-like protein
VLAVKAWIAAGVVTLATALFVAAVSASAAQANAQVRVTNQLNAVLYEAQAGDEDRVVETGNGTQVDFDNMTWGGAPLDPGGIFCGPTAVGVTCGQYLPVDAELGDRDDVFQVNAGSPPTTVHAGPGADQVSSDSSALTAFGGEGNDTLQGGSGDDSLNGGPDDDTLIVGTGADDVHGGAGTDVARWFTSTPVQVTLDDQSNDGLGGAQNIRSDVEGVAGGSGADDLSGDADPNLLFGLDGADSLTGGAGDDTLDGGNGADGLNGGPGRDTLRGGADDDTIGARDGFADRIDCGPGDDTAIVNPADVVTNCETVEYADNDHDGVTAERDCDDRDPAVHPGAQEIPGDGIDQDCDGADGPLLVVDGAAIADPGPAADPGAQRIRSRVDDRWLVYARYTKVARLVVRDVPAGARVTLRCRGKGCGFRSKTAAARRGRASLTKLFKGRRLKPGAVAEVRVTAPGKIGSVVRFTVRARKLPTKSATEVK